MLTEWELWACASHYVKEHGQDAQIMAAMRADELFAQGDFDGSRNFAAIVQRINQLLDTLPGALH